jgi:hemoglobin/transferrin/lactoferrin receptor protein
MVCRIASARALLLGVSTAALTAGATTSARAQSVPLDPITVVATKTEEKAIDSLAAVSTVRQGEIDQLAPSKVSDIFFGMPGVWFQERADDPATAINIRGLQDFGRVAVIIEGARQNFQKSGHNANGAFYLEPEVLSGVDVVRGPVANIYGSGAIGGVASFQLKDVDDVLKPGERWGFLTHGLIGSNLGKGLASVFAAARPNPNVDLFAGGTYRSHANFEAGNNGTGYVGLPGPGAEVPNTAYDVHTGLARVNVRPADGHEVKVTGLTYESDYNTGQPPSSQFGTLAQNQIVSGRWRYGRPEDRWFNFDNSVYYTRTQQEQVKIAGAPSTSTGRIGDPRVFTLETVGTDLHNTTRFDFGPMRNAVTYGGDWFRDTVEVFDPGGANDNFTPSGDRTVAGAFVQWKANYWTYVETILALRYDQYDLKGANGVGSDGERVSPKGTLGVTPFNGFTVYGTYAEGYRAPALTETIASGFHPPFASFPGAPDGFQFVPNLTLRPEIGKNKEVGVNLKYDNLLRPGDRFRAKANVFRNHVDEFIEAVQLGPINFWGIPQFFQYQNIAAARIEGVEFESTYDALDWFVGLSGHHIRGEQVATGIPLLTIPPDMIAATLGVRFFDRKLTAALRWQAVADKDATEVPPGATPREGYNLVNFYLGYQPTPDILTALTVENLLDEYYVRYLDGLPSPGITFKGQIKIRFGST